MTVAYLMTPEQAQVWRQVRSRRHVAMFKALPVDAWERAGMHEERGRLTLRQVVESIAAHDENHLAQIKAHQGDVTRAAQRGLREGADAPLPPLCGGGWRRLTPPSGFG